jgi:hypothetical protein
MKTGLNDSRSGLKPNSASNRLRRSTTALTNKALPKDGDRMLYIAMRHLMPKRDVSHDREKSERRRLWVSTIA